MLKKWPFYAKMNIYIQKMMNDAKSCECHFSHNFIIAVLICDL